MSRLMSASASTDPWRPGNVRDTSVIRIISVTPEAKLPLPIGRTLLCLEAQLSYLRTHPQVRDVVVSGGDVANIPWRHLESYLMRLLDIETVRDIRLAT